MGDDGGAQAAGAEVHDPQGQRQWKDVTDLHYQRIEGCISQETVLDVLAALGIIGLALYAWALFVDPWRRIGKLPDNLRDTWQPVIAALMSYAIIVSLMEGKTFSGDNIQWIVLVVILGISLRLTAVIRQDSKPVEPLLRATS
mgnify:CR=1 FL=1